MGLVPYIKTGSQHSAAGMNDLYAEFDAVLNVMTSDKSLYFMNGFSRYPIPAPADDPDFYDSAPDEYVFGLGDGQEDKTSSPKKYFFLDGAKWLDSTGQCLDGGYNDLGYGSECDCVKEHCGNLQNCYKESLVPAGEWGWSYKLFGQYVYGDSEIIAFPPGGDMSLYPRGIYDYEKEIHPLMEAWEDTFFAIDISPEQNLALGFENSLIDSAEDCDACGEGKWMDYEDTLCQAGTGPGTEKECINVGVVRSYSSYVDCHFGEQACAGVPLGEKTLLPRGSLWNDNFTEERGCGHIVPWDIPCPCPIGSEDIYCTNLQHSLHVPTLKDDFTVYEFKFPKAAAAAAAEEEEEDGSEEGEGGSEEGEGGSEGGGCYYCDDWEDDWNGPSYENNFQTLQGCYEFYCERDENEACCEAAGGGGGGGGGGGQGAGGNEGSLDCISCYIIGDNSKAMHPEYISVPGWEYTYFCGDEDNNSSTNRARCIEYIRPTYPTIDTLLQESLVTVEAYTKSNDEYGPCGGCPPATSTAIQRTIYHQKDVRLISYNSASYLKHNFFRPIDRQIKGEDEIRFPHHGWCWDENLDPQAYNDPNCWKEAMHGGKPPPETPQAGPACPDCYGFTWGCDMLPFGPGAVTMANHLPNLEQRFTPAELIFDGKKEKYKEFKFLNKYNKYKFFRIHNLNNYDMEFEFEPDAELEDATPVSRGIFEKDDSTFVVGECSAGPGHKITIPRHESRCVRRDWGIYTDGFNHFQRFLAGDALYQMQLTDAENVITYGYPKYFDWYDDTYKLVASCKSNNIINPFIIDDYIRKFQSRFQMDMAGPRNWDASGLYIGAGQRVATQADLDSPPSNHWDKYIETPEEVDDIMGEFAGTRAYEAVGQLSISGWRKGEQVGRSSYQLMTTPSHRNFNQDPFYDENGGRVHEEPLVALDNKDSIVADFLYHTGWILQTYNIKDGGGGQVPQCPNCVEKRLVPYSGARYVHDFINDMNVNVLPIEPTYMGTIQAGDCGLSGFTAAPMHLFHNTVHFQDEYHVDGPYWLALEGGDGIVACPGCPGGFREVGVKRWYGMPSYASALDVAYATDATTYPHFSGVESITSTLLDYDGGKLGPKHLRYVRHHIYSPNSGDWVKTVGKHVGFWGELKDREKWTNRFGGEDIVNQRQTLACSGLQESIRAEHAGKLLTSEAQFYDGGVKMAVICGDDDASAQALGFDTAAQCDKAVDEGWLELPTLYILPSRDGDGAGITKCTEWNKKRGVDEDCVEGNLGEEEDAKVPPGSRALAGYGAAYDGGAGWYGSIQDPKDPYAYSIHQMALSTNILGQNSWNHLKGQLYPIPGICEERVSANQCACGGAEVLNSHIDFMNTHDIKIGSYFYAKVPKPFGKTNMPLSTQGYELSTSIGYGDMPKCYPLMSDPSMGDMFDFDLGSCWGKSLITLEDYDSALEGVGDYAGYYVGGDGYGFKDCPNWTNMGAGHTAGFWEGIGELLDGTIVGYPHLKAGLRGIANHLIEDKCTEAEWGSRGKVELVTTPFLTVDDEWDSKKGTDVVFEFAGEFEGYTSEYPQELFVDKTARFNYASTVDELVDSNLHSPHYYKYSFWTAGIRNHLITDPDWGWQKYGKVGFECSLSDFTDKDWLTCGMPAYWNSTREMFRHWVNEEAGTTHENRAKDSADNYADCIAAGWGDHEEEYCGEDRDPNDPRGPCVDGKCSVATCGDPCVLNFDEDHYQWPTQCEYCGGYDHHGFFQYGRVPFPKSHIIPIKGGYIEDSPAMHLRPWRIMPLTFKHDYSKVGEDYSYYGYAGDKKAKTSFEARRDMFSITLGDINKGLKEFNKYDGTHAGGGYWTGYTGLAPCPWDSDAMGVPEIGMALGAGMENCDAATVRGWDGSENEGPQTGPDGIYERRFAPTVEPMPQVKPYAEHYKECCTNYCRGMEVEWKMSGQYDEFIFMDEDGKPVPLESRIANTQIKIGPYSTEKECRDAAGSNCGTGFLMTDAATYPTKAEQIKEDTANCKASGEKAVSYRYETLTAISPPGGFETKDAFNVEAEGENGDAPIGGKLGESSYKEEFFDIDAALNHWQFDNDDPDQMFYEDLHKMYLGGDPFDGNYMKPVYGEYGKFSYSYQKNLNLRYKFRENFQAWGSDVMGRTNASRSPSYDNSYQISKAHGVGYDGDGNSLEEADSPIVYSRYYRPIVSHRTPFGGLMSSNPIKYPSVIQLSNTRLHKDEIWADFENLNPIGLDPPANISPVPQSSSSWFWNTNRTKEVWANLEPHCDSKFLTGRVGPHAKMSPVGAELYHPTGILWNHPDLYLKEIRKEHIISAFKGQTSIDGEKNIIGFHREYSPIDEKFRMGRHIASCPLAMPAVFRYMPFQDIEGPTSITWDEHLSRYGPPRRAYEITGVALDEAALKRFGNEGRYWPACMAVYYAQNYVVTEGGGYGFGSADACMKKFFGNHISFFHENKMSPGSSSTEDFMEYWLRYKDYCPTLKFLRWNGEEPHDYYNSMFLRFAESCPACGKGNWKKHLNQGGEQKYNAEWECRATMEKECTSCDSNNWRDFDDEVRMSWPLPLDVKPVRNISYMDSNWYGNQNDTNPGHGGMDVSFHGDGGASIGAGLQGIGSHTEPIPDSVWDDMVANPVSVYAVAPGTVIEFRDDLEDQCDNAGDPDDPVHGVGGTKCGDVFLQGHALANWVTIDHGETRAGYRYSVYAHLQKGSVTAAGLSVGSVVARGQKIGTVGSSGSSAWPHLHFEVGTTISGPNGGNCCHTVQPNAVHPFHLDPEKSMWKDQCSLPIHDLSQQTTPRPPKCDSEGKFASDDDLFSELACRIAACAVEGEDSSCCPRCNPYNVRGDGVGDVWAYREMDIVPSGFPNINCEGTIDDVRLFEVISEGDTPYDECQACRYIWDDGPYDNRGRWGGATRSWSSGGSKSTPPWEKKKASNAPDLRSDVMYRAAGIPHFYDYEPIMLVEPPVKWPPPIFAEANWKQMAIAMGCEENVINPSKVQELIPSPPPTTPMTPLFNEVWTGVAWTSGICDDGSASASFSQFGDDSLEFESDETIVPTMNDRFLDQGHSDIQSHTMAERICAAHDGACCGFDYAFIRNPVMGGGQVRYYGIRSMNTATFGRHMDRLCGPKITWNNTNNLDYSARIRACEKAEPPFYPSPAPTGPTGPPPSTTPIHCWTCFSKWKYQPSVAVGTIHWYSEDNVVNPIDEAIMKCRDAFGPNEWAQWADGATDKGTTADCEGLCSPWQYYDPRPRRTDPEAQLGEPYPGLPGFFANPQDCNHPKKVYARGASPTPLVGQVGVNVSAGRGASKLVYLAVHVINDGRKRIENGVIVGGTGWVTQDIVNLNVKALQMAFINNNPKIDIGFKLMSTSFHDVPNYAAGSDEYPWLPHILGQECPSCDSPAQISPPVVLDGEVIINVYIYSSAGKEGENLGGVSYSAGPEIGLLASQIKGIDPYSKGNVFVHEAGHSLGLPHTFSAAVGGKTLAEYCATPAFESLGITDLPNKIIRTFGCDFSCSPCENSPGFFQMETLKYAADGVTLDGVNQNDYNVLAAKVTECGEEWTAAHNFMSYTRDSCTNHFTQHQVDRMEADFDEQKANA